MNLTILVIWIAAALLSYAVARNKGRDPVVAIAMGLLLGFLALIYYMLAKGSKEYEVKRAKELIHSSEVDEPEEEIKVEHQRTYKKTDNNAPGCLVIILLTIGGFIGIFAIGAIASALSNKSGNTQTYPTYQNYDNGSTSNTTPQKQIDYQSVKGYAFPEINQSAFKQSCIKEAGPEAAGISQAYCSCILKYIELNYSFKEFLRIEQEYLKTNKFPQDIVAAMSKCVK